MVRLAPFPTGWISVLAAAVLFSACKAEKPPAKPAPAATATSQPAAAESRPAAPADPLADPATAFAHQLELLRALDVDGLAACLVPAARDQVRLADVEYANKRMGTMPASDIAASIQRSGDVAVLKQKSGIELMTMVRIDGKWLARSAWWIKPEGN